MTLPTHPSVLVVSEVKAHEARMGLGDRPYASTTEFSPTGSLNGPHFDEIYRDHFAFVWRSARRLGVDASSLDDVVQEVFVIAHRRLPSFEGRSSVSTWLFGITLRVARDHRRSRARRPQGPHAEPDSLRENSPSPSENLERTEAVRLLHRILDELSCEQREVFVMSDLEQIPMSEIAITLDINENTGYGRLRAARRSFNEALARHRARDEWRLG